MPWSGTRCQVAWDSPGELVRDGQGRGPGRALGRESSWAHSGAGVGTLGRGNRRGSGCVRTVCLETAPPHTEGARVRVWTFSLVPYPLRATTCLILNARLQPGHKVALAPPPRKRLRVPNPVQLWLLSRPPPKSTKPVLTARATCSPSRTSPGPGAVPCFPPALELFLELGTGSQGASPDSGCQPGAPGSRGAAPRLADAPCSSSGPLIP